jgi:hypothetical protein
MKKFAIKTVTWYGLLALVFLLALLPILKTMAPRAMFEGYRDLDCQGVTCDQGQFCASGKQCLPVATRYPNNVPTGNM